MANGTFATAINCMDGRVQLPVFEWMKNELSVEYIDMITEAGPNKVLLEGTEREVESIKSRVLVSTEQHGSEAIAVIGHHGCAGNPVSREVKEEQIKSSVGAIKEWGLSAKVIGLYVNENWEVEQVV